MTAYHAPSPWLARPAGGGGAVVTFDYKTGKTAQGHPLEHIKAGTLSGLVEYLCFYAARAGRPSLVNDVKLGLDDDFGAIFWTLFPGFATTRDVMRELTKLAERAVAHRDGVLAVSVCDAVAMGVDPANRHLLWLPAHQQAEVVAGAERVVVTLRRGLRVPPLTSGWEGMGVAGVQAVALNELESKVMAARLAADIASTSGMTAHLLPSTVLSILADYVSDPAAPTTPAAGTGAGAGGGGGSATATASAPVPATALAVTAGAMAHRPSIAHLSLAGASGGGRSFRSGASGTASPAAPATGSGGLGGGAAGGGGPGASGPPAPPAVDLHAVYETLWAVPYDLVAAQWTYIEHGLFRAIPAAEFLACGWDKSRHEHASDAFRRYADHFNAMSLWVTAEVMAPPTHVERAAMIVRFIKVGVHLRRYNNFSALVQLCLGLRRDIVARLTDVWGLVPPAAMERLQALFAITDDKKNYRAYKEALKLLPPTAPVVPHLGAHTAELTMQDQLLPMDVPGPGGVSLIHFRRHRELYKLFTPIFAMQELAFAPLLPPQVPSVINMLNAIARPFYFAFEDDRDAAVKRLDEVSNLIQPPPPPDPVLPVGPIVVGEYHSTAPRLPGAEGEGEDGGGGGRLRKAVGSFMAAVKLLSPTRRKHTDAAVGEEGGEGGSHGDGGVDGGEGDTAFNMAGGATALVDSPGFNLAAIAPASAAPNPATVTAPA